MTQPGASMPMQPHDVLADELWFPEGPISHADGSWTVVEIRRQTVTHVQPDGQRRTVPVPGGPNGAAVGPDGWLYVCNNGGMKFAPRGSDPTLLPAPGFTEGYAGGSIDRINPRTGERRVLYRQVGDRTLRSPNDIVFDAHGGFWFTDVGKAREREMDWGSLYYATADGRHVREVVHPLLSPNGVGLSPDGKMVYVAETATARVLAWDIIAPGQITVTTDRRAAGGHHVYSAPHPVAFDSMAVEANGNLCLAALYRGAICVVSPTGQLVEEHFFPDSHVTNIAFGGPDLRTAGITLSGKGQLVTCPWPRSGLRLNFA